MIATIIIMLACVVLDQWTKVLAVEKLMPVETFPLIPDVLHFTYVENRGAAFGMLADHRWVFMILSSVAILVMLGWLFYEKPKNWWVRVSVAFIIAGGIGNMIDRVRLGYVVDFIDCRFIDFYVFNVADSFVCVGCGMFLVYVIGQEWKTAKEKKAAEISAEKEPEVVGDE